MTTTAPVARAGDGPGTVDRSSAPDDEPSPAGPRPVTGDGSSAGTVPGRVARPGGWAAPAILAGVAAVLGLLVTALALAVRDGRQLLAADRRMAQLLDPLFGGPLRGAARVLAELGSPWLFALAVIALAAWARWRGDRRLAVIVAAGPLLAVLLADLVLKPVLDRRLGTGFSFPSGHVTAAASLATAAVVAAHWHRVRHTAGMLVGATLASIGVTVAVVVLDWHAATDALGGLLLGPAVVLGTAAAILALVPHPRAERFVRPRHAFLGTVAVLGVSGLVRVPLVELSPGPTIALNEAVSMAAASEAGPLNGDYRGLSVRETSLTAFGWAWHQLSGSENEVLFRSAIIPPGTDADTYYAEQVQVFADAGRVAAFVAESALGYDVTTSGDGAQIVAVEPGSPADGHLVSGDLVTAIGSQPVETDDDLRAAIASAGPGPLDLTVSAPPAPAGADGTSTDSAAPDTTEADATDTAGAEGAEGTPGATRTVRHEVVTPAVLASTGRTGLGVVVATAGLRVDLPVEVTVDAGKIGGPSAGLLTGLTVYDRLSSADLAAGRTIAGTGTLDLDGNVGPIGGIEEKTRAAIAAGADLFLAPADQADDAREEADGRVEVIGVRTFSEALAVLGGPIDPG